MDRRDEKDPWTPAPVPEPVQEQDQVVVAPREPVAPPQDQKDEPVQEQDETWTGPGEPTPVTRGMTADFRYWQENYDLDGNRWIDESFEHYFTPDPAGAVVLD